MHFREEPVTPVYRHWMCEQVGCNGELLSTGESITRLSTSWMHRCGKCGHEDWAAPSRSTFGMPAANCRRTWVRAQRGVDLGWLRDVLRAVKAAT
jgi:hypothetical protein